MTRSSYVVFDGNDDRIATLYIYALSSSDDFTWAWWANQQCTGTADDGAVMAGNRYSQPGAGEETYEFIKLTPTQDPVVLGYNESSPLPFFIGGDDNGSGHVNEHFEGCIDDVALYRKALNAAEVITGARRCHPIQLTRISFRTQSWRVISSPTGSSARAALLFPPWGCR